ncbi:hypothetical protein KUTeg_020741 [Tegillarca granosa]|uniref:Histone deacetylase domain-containing protein n=1 Tax=Tegillarca granosa TaxID=220873 RepID=A0ABQ9EBB0_TEGGR|nr:hypothetical protein KUTeg_020741 [Tegillarca granosa]
MVPQKTVDNRCETDDPGAIIDAFHEKSFNQLFQDVPDVPELSEWANPHGPDPDEEFDVFNSEFEDVKCDIDRNGDSDTVEADKPLYAGATITLAASMVLVISFAMRHSLTGEALADLLVLLDLHCLTPNLCMKSIKTFMDLFRNFKAPLQFHYYCEQCLLYHGTVKQNFCRNCQTTIKRNSNAYFLVIPIISQLSSLFADGTLLKQIWEYKASQSKKDDGMISDIMDGKLYQERFRKDGYFKGSTSQDLGDLHISLQINTDGVSLFHSSTFSIWPIYFIINELPPHLRFTRSNRIFAGMWFGYSKPDFSTFLKPFAESLHEIYHAVWAASCSSAHATMKDVYQNAGLSLGCTLDLVQHIIQGKAKNGMAIIRRLKNVGISKGSVNECKADLIKYLKVDIDEKKEKPPGHHAMYNEFCGYCFLNNVAIAAKQAVDHYGLKRVLVIDWDVHHGQGTQYFFYNDPRKDAVIFDPELVLVSAGYDCAIGCPEIL